MNRIIHLLVLFAIFSKIDQSRSVIFWNFGNINSEDDYTRSRSASVYRGLLFSYSPAEKHEICEDVFYAQLYAQQHDTGTFIASADQSETTDITPIIRDGETTEGDPQYPLTVKKIIITQESDKPKEDKEDILFTCVGKEFKYRLAQGEYIISTAFRPSWMYSIYFDSHTDKRLKVMNYIGLSAEYVSLKEPQLEDQYVTIRQKMRDLEKESPKYVEWIANRDILLSLPRWKKLMLCASILSTPAYRDDNLEFSIDWIEQTTDKLEHYKKLTFTDPAYTKEEFYAGCVYCKGFANGDDYIFGKSTNLYFTQSFDDKDSLIVLKEDDNGLVFLSKYFRKVPVLMNAHEPVPEHTLHQNFLSFSREFTFE